MKNNTILYTIQIFVTLYTIFNVEYALNVIYSKFNLFCANYGQKVLTEAIFSNIMIIVK